MLNKYKYYKIVIITKTINFNIQENFKMVKMHKKTGIIIRWISEIP